MARGWHEVGTGLARADRAVPRPLTWSTFFSRSPVLPCSSWQRWISRTPGLISARRSPALFPLRGASSWPGGGPAGLSACGGAGAQRWSQPCARQPCPGRDAAPEGPPSAPGWGVGGTPRGAGRAASPDTYGAACRERVPPDLLAGERQPQVVLQLGQVGVQHGRRWGAHRGQPQRAACPAHGWCLPEPPGITGRQKETPDSWPELGGGGCQLSPPAR